MHKSLFILCPTDCLESIINSTFKQENYFYTSLGNSFPLNFKSLESIEELIIKHCIQEIYFVISKDNKIILDALGKQSFLKIRGLQTFYNEVIIQKIHSEALWKTNNPQFSVISYYLNKRIKELQFELERFSKYPIKIGGKIYNRNENVFNEIYSNLTCLEKHYLN